jgi:cell division protein FtsA
MAMLIGAEIERSGASVLPGGIVVTGGGAMLRGFAEMCQQVTDLPVRMAAPTGTIGMNDELQGPHCATVVGLLRWGARTGRRTAVRSNGHGGNGNHGVSDRFSRWLRELF